LPHWQADFSIEIGLSAKLGCLSAKKEYLSAKPRRLSAKPKLRPFQGAISTNVQLANHSK
jgi:hypothetical protein